MAESVSASSPPVDIVVLGASGFTGQFVVEELARRQQEHRRSWAVAGRNTDKLAAVLQSATAHTGVDLSSIQLIEADVTDTHSLTEMVKKCRLVLNCVGPYRFYGEPVVKACVDAGVHYVDISGEPAFLEKMQLVYSKGAEEAGCYVIGSCGFDSIPADMGVQFVKSNFPGTVNGIESYLTFSTGDKGYNGVHFTTYQSAIHGYASASELGPLRKQLFGRRLPKPQFPLPKRGSVHYSERAGGYCLPFMGSDKSVVQRSIFHNYTIRQQPCLQYNTYVLIGGWWRVMLVMAVAVVFGTLASCRWGRRQLERWPRLFSLGFVSRQGPTRQQMQQSSFAMTFFADGWSEKRAQDEQASGPPDRHLVAKVSGPECGYVATPICMLQSALTILEESDNMPSTGGVYSPAAAFAETRFIERLDANGVKFQILEQK